MKKVNIRPTRCNLCGEKVMFVTNDVIYKRQYGSGYAYLCMGCGAYVGTHKPRPDEALGLLADPGMRCMKMKCHDIFDKIWRTREERNILYKRLAKELKIDEEDCHFGYFDTDMLLEAYKVLNRWKKEILSYGKQSKQ